MNQEKPSQKKPEEPRNQKKSWFRSAKDSIAEGRRFFHEELWDVDLRPLPRVKTAVISVVRIIGIVLRSFAVDKCYMQAGTLTYLTLMSLIPIMALMFSVSKGLGAQEMLMESIGLVRHPALEQSSFKPDNDLADPFEYETNNELENTEGEDEEDDPTHERLLFEDGEFVPQYVILQGSYIDNMPDEFQKVIITIFSAVERTNVGTLGVLGLIFLVWTAIRVMGKVEIIFNDTWGVQEARPLTRRFSDYISILVVVPILVLAATSMDAFLTSDTVLEMVRGYFGELSMLYEFAIRWTMFAIMVLAFTFLLIFMPNTKVRFFPALIGGFVTALAWFAAQRLYFMAQGGVSQYNAIYGTFAALPFFLLWLHTSWLIVLFGAELAFAVQNHRTYHLEQRANDITPATLSALGMLIMLESAKKFIDGKDLWSPTEFGEKYGIPMRLIAMVVYTLHKSELLWKVNDEEDYLVPGRDLDKITFEDIELAFRGSVDPSVEKRLAAAAPMVREAEKHQLRQLHNALGDQNLRDFLKQHQDKID